VVVAGAATLLAGLVASQSDGFTGGLDEKDPQAGAGQCDEA